MIWIKQFNEDSGKLTKKEFALKYILPLSIIVISWFSLYNFINLVSTDNNLTHIKGTFKKFNIRTKNHSSKSGNYITKDLLIYINEDSEYYDIQSRYNYTNVLESLKVGDKIDIYTENSLCFYLWPIHFKEIYKLDSNGHTLFEYKQVKDFSLIMFSVSFGLILVIIISLKFQNAKIKKPIN